jgi:hypothetical protein
VVEFTKLYIDLVTELQERNCTRDRFIVDFINEPDTFGFFWDVRGLHPQDAPDRGAAEFVLLALDEPNAALSVTNP